MARLFNLPLRTLLATDGATCLLMGSVLWIGHKTLSPPLGLPAGFLLASGLILFPCAALMLVAAWPRSTPPLLAWLVVLGNALWVVASVAVVLILESTAAGAAIVMAQAAAVALMAWLEYRGIPQAVNARFA